MKFLSSRFFKKILFLFFISISFAQSTFAYEKTVVIMFAMETEAEQIIKDLEFKKMEIDENVPMKFYKKKIGDIRFIISLNGKDDRYNSFDDKPVDLVGTQSATLTAAFVYTNYMPNLIISVGTAGGFKNKNGEETGTKIGDVFISKDKLVFHDRRISIQGYQENGVGNYSCINSAKIAEALILKQGIVSTGNSLDLCAADMEQMRKLGADVKEMEAAAIAFIANMFNVPFMALKSITDFVDEPNPGDQFVANFKQAVGSLNTKLKDLINYFVENGVPTE